MTVYATPFNNSTKLCTEGSKDSGFASLDEVYAFLGEPSVPRSKSMLIYGPEEDRVVFSNFVFCVDEKGIKD